MSEIALAKINTFGISPQADSVSPSEEPVFVLRSGQLQDLITRAIQPLQDEVSQLRAIITAQDEKVAALEARMGLQEDNSLIQLRLINDLREATKKGPGKTEISRAEKIEKYLTSRPDHRATFETLRGHLGVDRLALNAAIKTLVASKPGQYSIAGTLGDKRKRILILLQKIG